MQLNVTYQLKSISTIFYAFPLLLKNIFMYLAILSVFVKHLLLNNTS